jgi:hypothetical protein
MLPRLSLGPAVKAWPTADGLLFQEAEAAAVLNRSSWELGSPPSSVEAHTEVITWAKEQEPPPEVTIASALGRHGPSRYRSYRRREA